MTKTQGKILMTRSAVTGFESLGAQMSRAQRYPPLVFNTLL